MSRRRKRARPVDRAFAAKPGHLATRPQTRGLTEGAILAALAALIAAAGLLIPPIAILVAPLPIMLLVIRWDFRTGVLATVVAGLILLLFFGPLVAFSTVVFGPIGLALGWGVRHERGATWTVLAGAAALCVSMLASLALAMVVLHQDVIGLLIRTQLEAMRQSAAMLEGSAAWLGVPPESAQPAVEQMHLLADVPCNEHYCTGPPLLEVLIRDMSLVMVALGSLLWGYLCHTVGRSLLRRLGYQIPALPPMLTWRLPQRIAAALVWFSGGLALAVQWVPALSGLVWSAVFLNLFVFGFLGALVAATWMNRRQIPRLAQAAFLLLLISSLSTLPLLALSVIGMLDTWYDYRRLTARSASPHAPGGADRPAGQGPALPDTIGAGKGRKQQPKAVSRP